MQKTLILSVLLSVSALAAQAINITGIISANTTWTKANNPYIITGNTSIDAGATLTIEPGVVVKFAGYFTLYIDGRIIANGTANDNITFTSSNGGGPNEWAGIQFTARPSTTDSSSLQYCKISYAQESIHILGSYVNIDNCSILYSTKGINVYSEMKQAPSITNNNISFNKYGLYGGCKAYSDISYNTFTYNTYGIYCTFVSLYTISYNNISFNKDGIYCDDSNPIRIIGNTILSNTGSGMLLGHRGVDSVSSNIIAYNDIGISFEGTKGNICHNTITNNRRGIQYSNSFNTGLVVSYNCIHSNTELDFVSNITADLVASNNYWNATDSQSISSKVVDYYDNVVLGKVKFTPFLLSSDTACKTTTQPTAIPSSLSNTVTSVKVYPNPANDILNIDFTATVKNAQVMIADMTGKLMYQATINSQKQTISISQWPAGVYLLKYSTTDNAGTIKLVKQ